MKRLQKGRNQTLAGKRKPKRKAAGAKPNATRQRQLAFRKKRRGGRRLRVVETLDKKESSAETASTSTEA